MTVRKSLAAGGAALLGLSLYGGAAQAGVIGEPGLFLEFDLELTSLNLSGGPFPIPLASDPGNALGDSIDGFGFVDSTVAITLSSQRAMNPGPASVGRAVATPGFGEQAVGTATVDGMDPPPINPAELDGQPFRVMSFFDVFFDITVQDVDGRPGRDFAGQGDGGMVVLQDNGPASLQSLYSAVFDADAPNFGLIPPPEADPYIGHFEIEIPLGGDINGNGENDKIKFTLAVHSVGDENRTFIQLPDGSFIDQFDSAAFLEGAIVDESTDPPFTIGMIDPLTGLPNPAAFGGPASATSTLLNPQVPEPAALALWGAGLGILVLGRRRR
ncbi:MAG: PEP-CTERM sorting domain-containing protein [Pseudomonadota bacterium]|nr:PEP-CTERM sorting domain-containing protein [Pseudomonadota bacterium]